MTKDVTATEGIAPPVLIHKEESAMKLRPSVSELIAHVELPKMIRVKQVFPRPRIEIEDIPKVVYDQIEEKGLAERVKPGMRIAITVGSRGVANVHIITKAIVDFCKARGAQPFIVPAMGSHGGATAEGQRQIVEGYGCTEEYLGCPILSSMETVKIGVNEKGDDVFIDKNAAGADGIIVSCRVKPHSAFRGRFESGIMKMMTIGLGKQHGAETCHAEGMHNMGKNVPLFGRCILKNAPILFAVATIENAFDETAKLVAVAAEDVEEVEPGLLEEAKANMPCIMVDRADVLVVDELGKNYSGDGMDPNITGNWPNPHVKGGLEADKVAVLNVSKESHGNAVGMGNCSAITSRIYDQMDLEAIYVNCITANQMSAGFMPPVMESDKECVQMCIRTLFGKEHPNLKVVRIPNSLHVEHIMLSESYLDQIKANPNLIIESEPEEWPFDENGNLPMKDGRIVF